MHSEGFVYSCRVLLENMRRQHNKKDVVLTSDFLRMQHWTWCLSRTDTVFCGVSKHKKKLEDLSQQYRPFAFLISRTKRGDGYDVLFNSIKRCLVLMSMSITPYALFVSTTSTFQVAMLFMLTDNSFVDAAITLCWPHIKLNATPKNASRNSSNFKTTAQNDILPIFILCVQQSNSIA